MPSSSSDSDRPLAAHVETLYPLARVLVGSKEAERLVLRVYEKASTVPPEDRPDNKRAWLFRLMVQVQEQDVSSSESRNRQERGSSFTSDSFRREVASEVAERALPIALAACSVQERLLLAIDILGSPANEALATVLDTTPNNVQSVRNQAYSSLRAALRDVLNGPERMLVDVALSDDALHDRLHDLFADRFQPPPVSLRSTVATTLQTSATEKTRQAESETSQDAGRLSGVLSKVTTRRALIGLLVLVVVGSAAVGASYLRDIATVSAPSSVIEMLAQHTAPLQPVLKTNDPETAAAYIEKKWGQRLSPPEIQDASLRGVGHLKTTDDLDIPILLYGAEEEESQIKTFVLNYALLDRLAPRVTLATNLRNQLAKNDRPIALQQTSQAVVLWRHRDDVFVSVAPHLAPETLRSRVRP